MKLKFVSAVLETTAILYGLPRLSSFSDASEERKAVAGRDLTIAFALSGHASMEAKQYDDAIQTESLSGTAAPDYPGSSSLVQSRAAEGVV